MKSMHMYLIIGGISFVVAVGSAIIASNMSATVVDSHPDWDAFDRSMWLTILVTIPAFAVLGVSAVAGLAAWLRRNK
jgi:hypothetical protein